MTTAAEDLVSTLSATFSGKFYPSVAPAGTVAPYAVYLLVTGVPITELDGQSDLTNWHWQIDIFARDKLTVDALAESAKTVMKAATLFKSVCIAQQDIYEEPAMYYRVLLEFSTWR